MGTFCKEDLFFNSIKSDSQGETQSTCQSITVLDKVHRHGIQQEISFNQVSITSLLPYKQYSGLVSEQSGPVACCANQPIMLQYALAAVNSCLVKSICPVNYVMNGFNIRPIYNYTIQFVHKVNYGSGCDRLVSQPPQ